MKRFDCWEPIILVAMLLCFATYGIYADTQDKRDSVLNELHKLRVTDNEECREEYKRFHNVYDVYERDKGLKNRIIYNQGGNYTPYNNYYFGENDRSDIEHIVARREAHISGLCHAPEETKKSYVTSLPNLTLAIKSVNEVDKDSKDAALWLPDKNKCWFVATVVRVKNLFNLSVDHRELAALSKQINQCANFNKEV